MKAVFSVTGTVILISLLMILVFGPPMVEKQSNRVQRQDTYSISGQAEKLHRQLTVADLHTDSLLWNRNLAERANYGHVDLPRLREGNVAIQAFTVVTKSPSGLNYSRNAAESRDNITLLALAQLWPTKTWQSLFERALFQAEKLQKLADDNPEELRLVRTQSDLEEVLSSRQKGSEQIAALLGTEGSHALDGKLQNVQALYDAGYRMMGLHHFFDNRLGGSLHGVSGSRLSFFGRQALAEMNRLGIIIDLAHSSESVVDEVLQLSKTPVVISHTGMQGTCDTPRNISDSLMKRVAEKGGLVGIGFWDAVCDYSPEGVVKTIRYAIDLLGENHVVLGSDFDGAVTTAFDASELAVLTEAMLAQGFTETEIRKVMGENTRDFLLRQLPES
ncbi:MAG: dipeptidase [Endozoicomonas sp.]